MHSINSHTYKASVIGYGRFGMLWAKMLSLYYEQYGQSSDNTMKPPVAISDIRNIKKDDIPRGIYVCDLIEAVHESETVFLCVPISNMRDVLQKITPILRPTTLVCDTCSVKVSPVSWMKELLGPTQPILATHPLFGPDSFTPGVHNNSNNTIITFPVRMNKTAYDLWITRFSAMGLHPYTVNPDEHDKQAAYTQTLTHILGHILKKMNLISHPVSTSAYNALLEIICQTCSDSPTLFKDINTYNKYAQDMRSDLAHFCADVILTLEQ